MHVLSVHFRNPIWVPLQRRYLDQALSVPHERYFSIEGISRDVFEESERLFPSNTNHIEKLEELTQIVYAHAQDDDWLLFIDSDAFLLTDIQSILTTGYDFVAVQRTENGDFHPHPCFTLVKVGLWKSLGDRNWDEGTWITASGVPATEMGGILLQRVRDSGVPWLPLKRMNSAGLHKLWFGVYGTPELGPVAYHHGAGSRDRVTRSDLIPKWQWPLAATRKIIWSLQRKRLKHLGIGPRAVAQGDPESINLAILDLIEREPEFFKLLVD